MNVRVLNNARQHLFNSFKCWPLNIPFGPSSSGQGAHHFSLCHIWQLEAWALGVGWGSGPLGAATRCPRRRRPFHFFFATWPFLAIRNVRVLPDTTDDGRTKSPPQAQWISVARSSPCRTKEPTRSLGLARRGQLIFLDVLKIASWISGTSVPLKNGPSARGLQTFPHSKTGKRALLGLCAPALRRCALRRRRRSRRRCCYTHSAACTRSALVRS